jgi:hypothetical protein
LEENVQQQQQQIPEELGAQKRGEKTVAGNVGDKHTGGAMQPGGYCSKATVQNCEYLMYMCKFLLPPCMG